jgi:hypothetical protein
MAELLGEFAHRLVEERRQEAAVDDSLPALVGVGRPAGRAEGLPHPVDLEGEPETSGVVRATDEAAPGGFQTQRSLRG